VHGWRTRKSRTSLLGGSGSGLFGGRGRTTAGHEDGAESEGNGKEANLNIHGVTTFQGNGRVRTRERSSERTPLDTPAVVRKLLLIPRGAKVL
jgi:hypothetical protein